MAGKAAIVESRSKRKVASQHILELEGSQNKVRNKGTSFIEKGCKKELSKPDKTV